MHTDRHLQSCSQALFLLGWTKSCKPMSILPKHPASWQYVGCGNHWMARDGAPRVFGSLSTTRRRACEPASAEALDLTETADTCASLRSARRPWMPCLRGGHVPLRKNEWHRMFLRLFVGCVGHATTTAHCLFAIGNLALAALRVHCLSIVTFRLLNAGSIFTACIAPVVFKHELDERLSTNSSPIGSSESGRTIACCRFRQQILQEYGCVRT